MRVALGGTSARGWTGWKYVIMRLRQCWPQTTAARGRALLLLACVWLACHQAILLLQLYLSEPTGMTLSFTARPDVDVPAVTVCGYPYHRKSVHVRSRNVSYARKIWLGGAPLEQTISSCIPGCHPNRSAPYPGGEVAVETGTWRTWITADDPAVCHTFMPNITWGQLANRMLRRQFQLRLWAGGESGKQVHWDHRVLVHPRRRPLLTNLATTELDPDQRVDLRGSTHTKLSVFSHVYERQSLRRSTCRATAGYDREACLLACYERQRAVIFNCSTPEMLASYPHLPECQTRRIHQQLDFTALLPSCGCPQACRYQRLVVSASVTPFVKPDTSRLASRITVEMEPIPEQVATERLSYPLISFASELSGYLSFVLGVSVMSLADLAGRLFTRCQRGTIGEVRGRTATSRVIEVKE